MTHHDHSTYVDSCYRCELSRDEVAGPDHHTYPDGASISILYHADGTIDEVVSKGCMVHSEQMDDHYDWIAYYAPDESERFVVRTYAKKGRLSKHGEWE